MQETNEMFTVTNYECYFQSINKFYGQILFWLGLTLVTIATSCNPLSKIGNKNIHIVTISKEDFNKLDEKYSNNFDINFGKVIHFPDDGWSDDKRLTILNQLFNNYPESAWRDENGKFIDPKEKWIKIEFNSQKIATVSMYHNDKFIFSRTIHGKFRNGYFYQRPKIYVIPFVPFVFGYCYQRARIGKTIDGDLIIDYSVNRCGFALVAGSSDKGSASSTYKRKK